MYRKCILSENNDREIIIARQGTAVTGGENRHLPARRKHTYRERDKINTQSEENAFQDSHRPRHELPPLSWRFVKIASISFHSLCLIDGYLLLMARSLPRVSQTNQPLRVHATIDLASILLSHVVRKKDMEIYARGYNGLCVEMVDGMLVGYDSDCD